MIRRFRRIIKSKRMGTPPLCGEYPSWVPYISFEVGEGRDGIDIVLEMVLKIIVSRRSFSWEVACLWHWR